MTIYRKIAAACDELRTSFPESHFLIVAVTKAASDGSNHWNLHSDLPSTEIPVLVKTLSDQLQKNVDVDMPVKGSA